MRTNLPRKLASIATDVVIGVVLVAVVALAAPSIWGWHQAAVLGGSMGSALPVGSVAVLRTVDAEALAVGDVIAVKASGARTVMHRITAIQEQAGERVAILKGDANERADPVPVVLRGSGDRLVYYVPLAGYLFDWARSPFVLLIAAALLLLPEFAPAVRGRVARGPAPVAPTPLLSAQDAAADYPALAIQARMRPNRQAARPTRG